MGDESTQSYTEKNAAGQLLTVRGYTHQEFVTNLHQMFGDDKAEAILASYRWAPNGQALANPQPAAQLAPVAMTPEQVAQAAGLQPAGIQQGVSFGGGAVNPAGGGVVTQAPQQQPATSNVAQLPQPATNGPGVQMCPNCGVGQLVLKQRKDGSGSFTGCSNFPACRFILKN